MQLFLNSLGFRRCKEGKILLDRPFSGAKPEFCFPVSKGSQIRHNIVVKKFYFLGFMSYCSHDPSAAMVEVKEDRGNFTYEFVHFEEGMLSRRKKSYHFPTRSISACLDYFGITIDEVTTVTTDFMDNKSFVETSLNYRHLLGDYIRQNLNLDSKQIAKPIHHHLAHAMGAWVGSGFSECAILAIDGLGSLQSTHSVFCTENGSLKRIFSQTTPGIGQLYNLITQLIGFKSGEEGKTMGLSPYGKDLLSAGSYPKINFSAYRAGLFCDYSSVINRSPNLSLLTDFNITNFEKTDLYMDFRAYLSYCVQKELENSLLYLAGEIAEKTKMSKLCITGGVALNCVANEKIAASEIFKEVYVQPDSADSGIPIGLAFHGVMEFVGQEAWKRLIETYKHPKFANQHAVFGNSSAVISTLPWQKVNIQKLVDAIEDDSVIALFNGGYEYGPRALGRRSFIANASSNNMKEILNLKIKHREAYRPFAPICLIEDFDDFFSSKHSNHEYMSYAVSATKSAYLQIPAVVHADGTSRVQIATKDCGIVYELLQEFRSRRGYGVFINTSLNDNDEPIVFDSLDALSCFIKSNSDILVVDEKMLYRSDIEANLSKLLISVQSEITERNDLLFKNSLRKLMRAQIGSVRHHTDQYLAISSFYKTHSSRIKLKNLLQEIKNGERRKFVRAWISRREISLVNTILEYYFSNMGDLSEQVFEIEDVHDSVCKFADGDLVISYNLSNHLRDLGQSKTDAVPNVFNFYASEDYPVKPLCENSTDRENAIEYLSSTYEGNNTKTIEAYFDIS